MEQPGYAEDRCWFCHGPDAGYRRGEDQNSKLDHDACEDCARKPYPQSKQFEEKL